MYKKFRVPPPPPPGGVPVSVRKETAITLDYYVSVSVEKGKDGNLG